MFGIRRTQQEVEREAERLRKQALLKGRERPREDLPHWINQAAPELYEACEEFVRKCEYAENFVAKVEKAHEERYLTLLKNLEEGKVFKKDEETVWKCRNCGHLHYGNEAPETCPVCAHPRAYFELHAANY